MDRKQQWADPLVRSLLQDLVLAVTEGDAEHVQTLLLQGVRPDIIDLASAWSALHAAVLSNVKALDTLLPFARSVDGPRVGGATPLSYVVHELGESPSPERRKDLLDALKTLLAAGANPRAGAPDQSALELASLYGFPDVESMLMEAADEDGT